MACILVVFMVFGLGYVQRRRCQQTSGCLWQWQLLKGPEPRDCIHHALSLFAWNESNTAETAFNWLTVFNERALDWIVCQYGNKTVLRLGLTNSNNAASVWLIMSLLYSQTIVFCLVILYLSIVKIFKRFFVHDAAFFSAAAVVASSRLFFVVVVCCFGTFDVSFVIGGSWTACKDSRSWQAQADRSQKLKLENEIRRRDAVCHLPLVSCAAHMYTCAYILTYTYIYNTWTHNSQNPNRETEREQIKQTRSTPPSYATALRPCLTTTITTTTMLPPPAWVTHRAAETHTHTDARTQTQLQICGYVCKQADSIKVGNVGQSAQEITDLDF